MCDAVFEEHTGSVTALTAVRPAGAIISAAGGARIAPAPPKYRRFVSSGCDCVLKVWDANTLLYLSDLRGHTEFVMCVAPVTVSTVISGSWDKVRSERSLISPRANMPTSTSCTVSSRCGTCQVEFSRKINILLPAFLQTLKLWDITTGQCLRTMKGHLAGVNTVAVMPDGRVVSGGLDRCGCFSWACFLASVSCSRVF